jgi:hypothetical protein
MRLSERVLRIVNRYLQVLAILLLLTGSSSAETTITVNTPMPPPSWALAQRALLKAGAEGAEVFAAKYLDDRGFFRCVERWGGNDGPDDVMENFQNWTLLYALGGPESLLRLYEKAWEGHLIQYTRAKAAYAEMAKEGMLYKEFITSFDWEHTGEGLAAFFFYGLARPADRVYLDRVRRFAGFYMNEDPQAPNYDPKRKIIRSLHNGSRGPKLTPASEEDWGGDPVPGRPERLTRYSTASNIKGDHPLNLVVTSLAMTAYLLTQEAKYRDWILEYTGAWKERILSNGGNIPTNIGLDGQIGAEWGGKWYGGVFGWDFWPQSDGRNYYIRGPRIALGEALMLTGDQSFIEPLRQQISNLYAAKKTRDGTILLPNKHGDDGWYGYQPERIHFPLMRDLYLWSMDPSDLHRIASDPWIAYLEGEDPEYPFRALQAEMSEVRQRVNRVRQDTSTPDTRSSDHAHGFNPVMTTVLVNLTLGGNNPGGAGNVLHSRFRYFDPEERRAGLSRDVAALVEKIEPEGAVLTLVNTNQIERRLLVIQMGAYGEHECLYVETAGRKVTVNAPFFQVLLEPGSGSTIRVVSKRFAHQPTLAFPWQRSWQLTRKK